MFQQPRHYWAAEAGPLLCIGLSTTRFRSNRDRCAGGILELFATKCVLITASECSVHEVFFEDEQMHWFEAQLQAAGQRPVAVFTHAPILGSGLRAVLSVGGVCTWACTKQADGLLGSPALGPC